MISRYLERWTDKKEDCGLVIAKDNDEEKDDNRVLQSQISSTVRHC